MAIRSRKLFPAATETNHTSDCSEFCYPGCPYGCYFSDFYNPPSPSPLSSSDRSHPREVSPFLIALIGLAGGCILLCSYYILKFWARRRRRSRNHPPRSDGGDEEFFDENRLDHPIWYIATAGLQQSVINSITVCKFKKNEGLVEGTECSVCLSEFQEDETLRLLPKCSHAFHIRCVDTWLRSHTNCPLCRAHIVVSNAATQEDGDLGTNEETQMENAGINGELPAENQVPSGGRSGNGGETVEQREVVVQSGEITPKEGIEAVDSTGINGGSEQNETEGDRERPLSSSEVMDSSAAECEGRSVITT